MGKQVALSLVVNVPTGGGVIYEGASVRSESTKIPKIALHAQIISLSSQLRRENGEN